MLALGTNRDNMTLENPYPIFIFLYDNIVDSNVVASTWVYCKDLDNPAGIASSQTDAGGRCAVDVQNVSTDGDKLVTYEGTVDYEFTLDVSNPITRIYLYQNASNSDAELAMAADSYGTELCLHLDNYVDDDVNIKTIGY